MLAQMFRDELFHYLVDRLVLSVRFCREAGDDLVFEHEGEREPVLVRLLRPLQAARVFCHARPGGTSGSINRLPCGKTEDTRLVENWLAYGRF